MAPAFYTIGETTTPPLNRVLSVTVGALAVFVLAFFYGLLLAWFPVVQINIFFPVVFGAMIGMISRLTSKIFKVREKRFIVLQAIILSLFGLYFSWVAYVMEFVVDDVVTGYFQEFVLLMQPWVLWEIIVEMNEVGVWSVFGSTPTGALLTLIWIGEALMIIGSAFYISSKYIVQPYSETHNRWYHKYILNHEFAAILDFNEFIQLEGEALQDKLSTIRKGGLTRFGRVSIYTLDGEDKHYLLFENVMRNSKGKGETSETIIDNLQISDAEAKSLIAKFFGKKSFLDF